jgi:monofunctional glycosyltransferase
MKYKKQFFIFLSVFFLWFIPWTPLLNLGILFYFPYKPDGKNRYLRVTGPLRFLYKTNWTPQKEIPKPCSQGVVPSEDSNFYVHHGVDWDSLNESVKENLKRRKTVRGGSTITMQLVKNGFLYRKKTMFRKLREIIGAFLLDLSMEKEKQIVWYLNIIEFGPNVYGIKEASSYYFKKSPKQLNKNQCFSLLALIPSPVKRGIKFKKGIKDANFIKRYKLISKTLY